MQSTLNFVGCDSSDVGKIQSKEKEVNTKKLSGSDAFMFATPSVIYYYYKCVCLCVLFACAWCLHVYVWRLHVCGACMCVMFACVRLACVWFAYVVFKCVDGNVAFDFFVWA